MPFKKMTLGTFSWTTSAFISGFIFIFFHQYLGEKIFTSYLFSIELLLMFVCAVLVYWILRKIAGIKKLGENEKFASCDKKYYNGWMVRGGFKTHPDIESLLGCMQEDFDDVFYFTIPLVFSLNCKYSEGSNDLIAKFKFSISRGTIIIFLENMRET